jgi:hypothetical protein
MVTLQFEKILPSHILADATTSFGLSLFTDMFSPQPSGVIGWRVVLGVTVPKKVWDDAQKFSSKTYAPKNVVELEGAEEIILYDNDSNTGLD